jgi:predicted phosphohydrolase
MKFELKDGKLSQGAPQQEQPKPQAPSIAPKNPFYEEIRKQETASMMQQAPASYAQQAAMQQQQAAMMQQQMAMQAQQEELARQEIMRQQVLQQQMAMQQQQAVMMQAAPPIQQVPMTAKITIFLTESQVLQPIEVPMDKVEEATTNLDQAIMSQSVYKYALTAINGLYIKRYTIE